MQRLFEFDEHIGDWRVLVQSRDIQNGAIQSRHIAPDAVTTDKIGNGEVKTRNIAPEAVTTEKIGDGEVKTRNIARNAVTPEKLADKSITGDTVPPGSVPDGKLADGAVTPRTIRDGAVLPEKLDPSLLNEIRSAGQHGYVLATKFGDSNLIGICQRTLTIAVNRIWEKLEEITGEVLKGISMVVSPEYYIGEEGCDVHVTANTVEANGIFEKIAFFVNGIKVWPLDADYAENVETVEFDTHIDDTSVIKCEAQILGVPYERQKAIMHYSSFWLGAGSTYEDIMDVQHLIPIKNGMRGAYDVDIADDDHIIVIVGESLASGFIRADINGAEIAFTESTVTIDGNIYKVFISENTFEEGTINVDING